MDNLSVHKTKKVMAVYERLNITPIFNMPYSPEFNGIESYFSLVKAEYKKLALNQLLKDIPLDTISLIKRSVDNIDDEKVKKCVKYGLS